MKRLFRNRLSFIFAAGLTGVLLFACGCGGSISGVPNATAADPSGMSSSPSAYQPKYDSQGRLLRPKNHHEWIFVGAPVTPNDMNDGKAAFPEFHNVYIDPTSYTAYKKTGEFRDGTVILKELVTVGSKSMDSGNGYFQGEFASLEAMVKDRRRFANEPGGWAFFRFGEAPHYQPIGARMSTESCNSCHSGAGQDYVFVDTYPVLRAAKTQLSN